MTSVTPGGSLTIVSTTTIHASEWARISVHKMGEFLLVLVQTDKLDDTRNNFDERDGPYVAPPYTLRRTNMYCKYTAAVVGRAIWVYRKGRGLIAVV